MILYSAISLRYRCLGDVIAGRGGDINATFDAKVSGSPTGDVFRHGYVIDGYLGQVPASFGPEACSLAFGLT